MKRIQYCQGPNDISHNPWRKRDADEVRVWDNDFLLIGFHKKRGRWVYGGSDKGHAISEEMMARKFQGIDEALEAFGQGEMVSV